MTASTEHAVLPLISPPRERRWLTLLSPIEPPDRFVQATLPLTFDLPSGVPATPTRSVRAAALNWVVGDGVPPPHDWAGRFLQAVLEVVTSERSPSQLVRWTAPKVFDRIEQARQHVAARQAEQSARRVRHHVVSVHVHQVHAAAAEVAARVVSGRRSRALAARLEFERGRWTCTALDFG